MTPFLLLYGALVILMFVGLVGAFVPALPGTGLIVAAIAVWRFASPVEVGNTALITGIIAFVISLGIGYLATYLGAKRVGASRWGQVGSMIGLIIGFLGLLPALPVGGPLLGVLVGAMLGAFVGEFLYRRELPFSERLQLSGKVSLAVVVSSLIGTVLEGLLAFIAIVVFLWTTWPQTGLA